MIRFHLDAIEQLDVALEHLERKDKNATRFALSLIDNVAELALVKLARTYEHDNEHAEFFRQGPVHSVKEVEKASGIYFPDKLTGLKNLGCLSEEQSQVLRNLHSFRNSSHHFGETHEKVLHSITSYYLQQTCLLVSQYKSRTTCLNDWLDIPFRTKRYLGEIKYVPNDIRSINSDVLFTAYKTLSLIVESFKTNLPETLAKDLLDSIESFEESLTFLLDGGPAIFEQQEIFTYLVTPEKTFSWNAESYWYENKSSDGYKDYLKKGLKLKEKKNPIATWKQKAEKIKAMEESKALETYCRFLDKKEEFTVYKNKLDEHTRNLDDWVQLQIDIAREK
jgi:hypothetical protein